MSVDEFKRARDFLLAHGSDYAGAQAGFAWPKIETFNWALDWFDGELAARHGDQTALLILGQSETRLSFAQLKHQSSRFANGLRAQGAKRGDAMLLMLGNCAELWIAMLAAMKLGLVMIPAATLLAKSDIVDRLERGGARILVVDSGETAKFPRPQPNQLRVCVGAPLSGWLAFDDILAPSGHFTADAPTNARDPMLLYFTSGTTAQPKLVLHSYASYPVGHLSTMFGLGLKPGDVHLNISSPGWAKHAWSSVFAPWNAGATIVALDKRFEPRAALDDLVRHRVTSFCAPPTVWRLLIQQDLAQWKVSLREANSAGEPLNPEVIEQVARAWGVSLRDSFGQTETTMLCGNSPGQPVKAASMGRPMPGYRLALLDADDQQAELGEIAVALEPRPIGMMQGYRDAGALKPLQGAWYRTGDVASRDAEGYLTYIGRADDVFKSSDYRISPFELESALIEHEAVAEAAVVPAPDAIKLAVPKAYIVLAQGHAPGRATALSILRHIRERLAPFKRVRRIEFAELPKTISGKIRRVELRQREAELAAKSERAPSEFRVEDFPELG